MIVRLIQVLRGLDPLLTPEEIADALWLAERLGGPADRDPRVPADRTDPAPAEPAPTSSTAAPPEPAPTRISPAAPEPRTETDRTTGPAAPPALEAGLYLAGYGSSSPFMLRSPAPPALPRALRLSRALRPLRVAAPSRVRVRLDERATAHQIAELGVWEPVLRPALERRLDLALVVDTGPSMTVWRRTVEEFQSVLERLGAFRDVRVWHWDSESAESLLRPKGSGSARDPDELIDPTGRRVVIVVSDCIGGVWGDGRAATLLERWGRSGPVAIVQPLPRRLWWRCAVAPEPVRLRAARRGAANDRLTVRSPDDGAPAGVGRGVPVPVLALDPRWLQPWAALVGAGERAMTGVALFTGDPASGADANADDDDLPPLQRVLRFRAASSPTAFRLAGYLAAAPLRLPVMRLVQRAMLPDSTPAHLAEVFLSGLLQRVTAGSASNAGDAEDVDYEFRDGVREELLSGLDRGEALRVLREVWAVIKDRLGSSLDFPALLKAVRRGEPELSSDQPFAQVTAQVLARLGGRYGEIAQRLAASSSPPPPSEPDSPDLGGGAGGSGPEPTEPRIWGGLPPRNPTFTGRADLLSAIRTGLGRTVTALLPDPGHAAGGQGKSELAVEYAYRHAHEYDLVWWIPAEQLAPARSSLAELARRLGVPRSDDIKGTVESVLDVLRSGEPYARWLLIYDSAAAPADLLPLLPVAAADGGPLTAPSPAGHVLITSRDSGWQGAAETVRVGLFERPESISLIRLHDARLSVTEADRLAGRVGDLPLGVELVAGWHAATGGNVEEYLRLFDRELARLPAGEQPGAPPPQLVAALEVTLDRLSRESPDANSTLELSAFFGPEPIALRLLTAGRSALATSPLHAVMAGEEPLRRVMLELSRFSLARLDPETAGVRLHRLVRSVLQTRLDESERSRIRGDVHRLLATATPDQPPDDATAWDRRAEITPHILPSEVIDGESPESRAVALDQMLYLNLSGDYESSRLLAELAQARWSERFGPDDESVLDAGRALADALRALGEIARAADLNLDLLNRMTDRLGPDHHSRLFSANSVGADLRLLGRFHDAHALDMDTWRRMQGLYGSDHLYTLMIAHSVGIDLRLLGRFHQAHDIDNDALQRLERQFGRRHRDTLLAVDHLAHDLHGLGRYDEALRLQRGSLQERRLVLGPDHAFVLRAEMSHSRTLRKSGSYAEAERLARGTLESHVRRLGEHHPDTLAAKRNLAVAALVTGNVDESLRLSRAALASYRTVLGGNHPFTHACAAGLARVLRTLGDYQSALEADQGTLRALGARGLFGPDHYATLCCSVGLMNDLYLLGEFHAAYDRSVDTLRRLRASQGPDHPYTWACAHNHGVICRAAGLAPSGTADPVAALRRRFGEGHPEVIAAARGDLLECDVEPTPI